MDIVYIRDFKIDTVIGMFQWERRIQQTLVLDVEMAWDIRPAAASDAIDDALDYRAVSERLKAHVSSAHYQLVETLAESIWQILREEFSVSWCRLRVSKPGAVRGSRDVGVLIERGEKPA
ncbi:dihydroneopterin aldolase [Paraperlucidibaca baekdonensis]|uniref:7,8-dihydroneopterin aldolase n=1 Tax=Paraperlucidibaca baekdonensis TaxID=748120 RepID=A0A3E0H9G4_9GAMM|nr:dihydroneopterin aldolase [Paraperlucidibaca baekdonensis]REH40346.1 dihydroneopterin aldolase [Paraperlucidibaca baekdonensis]